MPAGFTRYASECSKPRTVRWRILWGSRHGVSAKRLKSWPPDNCTESKKRKPISLVTVMHLEMCNNARNVDTAGDIEKKIWPGGLCSGGV